MIRHSVILTLKSSLSPEDKTQYFDAVNELKQIPGVQKFEVLKQTSAKNPFEFGISMEFESQEAYDLYTNHSLHSAFVEKYWAACVEDFLEIDYQILDQ
jgi:heme-degrading monooxygenase HmoA